MNDDNPYRAPDTIRPSERPMETDTATKLPWYDNVWLALPFALIVVGGAIGGACGGAAWGINQKVFRATRHRILRYVWTGLISVAAVVVYLLLAITLHVILSRNG